MGIVRDTVENTRKLIADTPVTTGELVSATPLAGSNVEQLQGLVPNDLGIGGAGYQWVDETANRAVNIVYTNTTGKPIVILISALVSAGYTFRIKIDGTIICQNESSGHIAMLSVIVPNNSTYELAPSTTTSTINYWFELK